MITARVKIADGKIQDITKSWGFIPLGSSKRLAPPEKKRDTSSYAEDAGEHVDARTVDDVFDYKMRFILETPNRNLVNANSKIKAWNDAVREKIAGSDVKRCKTITLYDDRMRCRIVGIPEVIAEVGDDDFYRWQNGSMPDCVVFELTVHVSDPNLCSFDVGIGIGAMAIGSTFLIGGIEQASLLNL